MVGDLFSAFVLTRTISEDKIPGQRPFSAFVLTRTISEGPLPPGGSLQRTRLVPPKILVPRSWYQDLGTRILVPGSWYQDLGTKIYGEPERRSLSVCRGGTGGCKPPARGSGGLEAPQEQQGFWERQPPSQNNLMVQEPGIQKNLGSNS